MKTYRDSLRSKRRISRPEIIAPVTAYAAFDKAAQYFGMKIKYVPVDEDFRADVRKVKRLVNRKTAVIVGSAPSFPHGMIDPLEEMSEIALKAGVGFHVDACLGGFVLPWAEEMGYPVPPFDFRLPGVTSISVDTHKYGYASKGTSVILYRNGELRRFQYFSTSNWPGGLYVTPTFAGSRPGALSAGCWAALNRIGKSGYLKFSRSILETAESIKEGIRKIPELYILGDPQWVIAFSSESLNIYKIWDRMAQLGWSLNSLHNPPAIHICVTLPHTKQGVADRFLNDLAESVSFVKKNPDFKGDMAPIYGMAASIP